MKPVQSSTSWLLMMNDDAVWLKVMMGVVKYGDGAIFNFFFVFCAFFATFHAAYHHFHLRAKYKVCIVHWHFLIVTPRVTLIVVSFDSVSTFPLLISFMFSLFFFFFFNLYLCFLRQFFIKKTLFFAFFFAQSFLSMCK